MKVNMELFFVLFLAVIIASCNVDNSKKSDQNGVEVKKELPKNIANLEVEITGMTCEIGCAKLIQSKLYKIDGVSFAEVSFEKSNGKITYDSNRITNEELKRVIESIAGGDLYKVEKMVIVEDFIYDGNKVDL